MKTKPPDWVGTPEVQSLLARAIAAELREQARLLRVEYADIMLTHRSAGLGAAEQLEHRADELDSPSAKPACATTARDDLTRRISEEAT